MIQKIHIWSRANLFSSVWQSLFTVLGLFLIVWIGQAVIQWSILEASFRADTLSECQGKGACWAIVKARWQQFFYGFYPESEYWRIHLSFICFLICVVMAQWAQISQRLKLGALILVLPLIFVLLRGDFWGLEPVRTDQWGGLTLTLVLAFGGIIGAFPLALLLALGRQSKLPLIKTSCIIFIEAIRGVPLISILFMASFMLPLFLPEGVDFNKLLRALIGIMLFQAAYLAEVIRGGLNALSKGQYEASLSLGLSYWQMMRLVILPQALRIMIPGIINTFIALFKDTTLVLMIGLFDFLGIVQAAITDPKWIGSALEVYVFCALVYWMFCFSMSLCSKHLEIKFKVKS